MYSAAMSSYDARKSLAADDHLLEMGASKNSGALFGSP